ncbi:MAG: DUF1566 domain-containing protein [Bacteriovoracaceae bacterium]
MKFLVFFFLLLSSVTHAKVCGLQGTLDERIKECALTKENFALVASDDKGVEVYQDTKTKLLWSNRIMMDFNHYGSQKACSDFPASSILKDHKWRLPTVREFEQSASHGMKNALPNMNNWFWTSTPVRSLKKWRRRRQPQQVFLWDGVSEKTDAGDLKDAASVRCVSH